MHGDRQRRDAFPKLPLYGAVALILFSVAVVMFGQYTEIGTVRVYKGSPEAVRDIVVERMGGEVLRVSDANTGSVIAEYAQGEGGFVRGSQRAFRRMRMLRDIPDTAPYRLMRWSNGSVSLSDTATGERFHLNAFGKDNAEAFARFLHGYGGRIQ